MSTAPAGGGGGGGGPATTSTPDEAATDPDEGTTTTVDEDAAAAPDGDDDGFPWVWVVVGVVGASVLSGGGFALASSEVFAGDGHGLVGAGKRRGEDEDN